MGRSPRRDHFFCTVLYCTFGVELGRGCQTPSYLRSNCQCLHCKQAGILDAPPYPEVEAVWKGRPEYERRINGISCGQFLLALVRKLQALAGIAPIGSKGET